MQISLCPQSTGVPVAIANPIAEEFSALRQDMLPGLIEAFASNLDRGNGPLNGFEIGRIFWRENGAYREADRVAGILGGNPTCGDWQKRSQPLDWFAAKGIVAKALQRLGLAADYKPKLDADNLHPGRTASLWLGDRYLGVFGQLHPQLRRERDLPDEVYAFQLDLNLLIEAMEQRGTVTYRAFSTFPASDRDIAFFSPVALDVASLEQAIAQSAGELLESVELFDDYRGKGVPAGQRSLAFRLIYRAGDRTLTDSEVETAHQKVREHLEKTFQVSLRS
jgi:phenylalanyl-tRNA synthetase beta chain